MNLEREYQFLTHIKIVGSFIKTTSIAYFCDAT